MKKSSILIIFLLRVISCHDTGTPHDSTTIYNSTDTDLKCESTSNCEMKKFQVKLKDRKNENKVTSGTLHIYREYQTSKITLKLYSYDEDLIPSKKTFLRTVIYRSEFQRLNSTNSEVTLGKIFTYQVINFPGKKGIEVEQVATGGILSIEDRGGNNLEDKYDYYIRILENPEIMSFKVINPKSNIFGDAVVPTLEEILNEEAQIIHDFEIIDGSVKNVTGKMSFLLIMNILLAIFSGFFLLSTILMACISYEKVNSKYHLFYSIPHLFQLVTLIVYLIKFNKIVILWVFTFYRFLTVIVEIPNMMFSKKLANIVKDNFPANLTSIFINMGIMIVMLVISKEKGVKFIPYLMLTTVIGGVVDHIAFNKKLVVYFGSLYFIAPDLAGTFLLSFIQFYTSPTEAQYISLSAILWYLGYALFSFSIIPIICWIQEFWEIKDFIFSKKIELEQDDEVVQINSNDPDNGGNNNGNENLPFNQNSVELIFNNSFPIISEPDSIEPMEPLEPPEPIQLPNVISLSEDISEMNIIPNNITKNNEVNFEIEMKDVIINKKNQKTKGEKKDNQKKLKLGDISQDVDNKNIKLKLPPVGDKNGKLNKKLKNLQKD